MPSVIVTSEEREGGGWQLEKPNALVFGARVRGPKKCPHVAASKREERGKRRESPHWMVRNPLRLVLGARKGVGGLKSRFCIWSEDEATRKASSEGSEMGAPTSCLER
jgi:hypothetical protein